MPDGTAITGDAKKIVSVIFSLNTLKILTAIVGASWTLITPILIAFYCHRFSIPFFEAMDYLGKYVTYLVVAISIKLAVVVGFLLLPSTISYYVPRKFLRKVLFPKRNEKSRKWKTFCKNLSYASQFYWPGILIMLSLHYFLAWSMLHSLYNNLGNTGIANIISFLLIIVGALANIPILIFSIIGACNTIRYILKSFRNNSSRYSPYREMLGALQIITLIMFMIYFIIRVSLQTQEDIVFVTFVIIFLPFLIISAFQILVLISSENLKRLLASAIAIGVVFIFIWPGPSAHMRGILSFLKVGGEIWVKVHFVDEEKRDKLNRALMKNFDEAIQEGTGGVFQMLLLTKERVYVQIRDTDGCHEIQQSTNLEITGCSRTIGIPTSDIFALTIYSYSRLAQAKP